MMIQTLGSGSAMPSGGSMRRGRPYLKLSVPQGNALRKVADLLNALAGK
jgi:hypothetical protein